jgi:hypothetical protein
MPSETTEPNEAVAKAVSSCHLLYTVSLLPFRVLLIIADIVQVPANVAEQTDADIENKHPVGKFKVAKYDELAEEVVSHYLIKITLCLRCAT